MIEALERYVEGVESGEIPACVFVKLAVKRHLNDLEQGAERGIYFDEEKALHAIEFIGFLKHSKGEWAGTFIKLMDWQIFIVAMIFGWMREDGTRRFSTAFLEIARKNGKTTLAAAIGLYLMIADNEPGAEIYTAATKREQARIAHQEATRMVKSSPFLRKRIRVVRDNLSIAGTASKYEPLGGDSNTLDGLNVHGAIIDELHAHKNRDVWDVLETGMGSRRQPLIFSITTAGMDRNSLCWDLHEYTDRVLNGIVEDDSFFGIIFTIDAKKDGSYDWENEDLWACANPSLGISKKLRDMQKLKVQAREMPAKLSAFLQLHLNIWTQSVTKWMNMVHWNRCGDSVDENGLKGRICYAGLDLSSNIDISAFILVFPPEIDGDKFRVLCRFWIPEDTMKQRSRDDRVPYDVWVRQGYIEATPGNVIDYEYIFAQIEKDAETFSLEEIAFDRWGSQKIIQEIEEMGLVCVQFGQGMKSMNPPMRELERLVLTHDIAHGNNPVLNWMADNVVVRKDPAGNIKPDKEKSREKIDGIVGMVMGLDRAIIHKESGSVYDDRGLREI